jgi:hypothetical protein
MERRPQEVAAGIAGEDAPGPVAAVGGRGEAQDQNPRVRVAKSGEGPRPVLLAREASRGLARGLLAPLDEPRTTPAADNLTLQDSERGAGFGRRGGYFSRSLSIRRETTDNPRSPITVR